jgi:hypothetical protein
MDNDYKLNILTSFTSDHIWKYLKEYENCYMNDSLANTSSLEAKDRMFLACHDEWINKVQKEVPDTLKARAKELFD